MAKKLQSLNSLNGKTIVAAQLKNNRTTLSLVLSGGRKINIDSGTQLVVSIESRHPKTPKLYVQSQSDE